jgi:SNF2 family DNA or RNA helicase
MSRKDELLEFIAGLQATNAELTIKRKNEDEKRTEAKKSQDVIQKAYDEIKRELDRARDSFNIANIGYKQADNAIRLNSDKLSSYQRELSRLLDAERIHKRYLDNLDEFRNSCLNASWRPENRADGLGAFEHQIDGAIVMAAAKQGLLGDQRGLGKTLTALIWMDMLDIQRAIVVCPPDTMDNFIREVHMWAPHRNVIKLGGMGKGERDFLLPALKGFPQFILVVNYQAWRKDPRFTEDLVELKVEALIEDEAHHAKNMETTTCKGILDIRFGINGCIHCGATPRIGSRSRILEQWDTIICDCGHEGPLTDYCSIKYVLPMTGTPILNRPQEIFPHLHITDPENFRTINNFLRDFCVLHANGHWGWRHGAEETLIKKLGHRYLARTRDTTGVKVPPCTPVDHILTIKDMETLYPKQYKAYCQARDYAQLVLDPDSDIAMSMTVIIAVIMRLRQVLTWPAAIELKIDEKVGEDFEGNAVYEKKVLANLDVHESLKLDKAQDIIQEVVEEGERAVLFSQFKAPLHELQRRLLAKGISAIVYDGSTGSYMKNQIQLDFDAKTMPRSPQKPRWDVVLCNYKAAAEGLNFTGASQMVILDEEWNPGKKDQAHGRIDRIGQTKETQIHTIRVEGTIDKWLSDLIAEKASMIDGFETEANIYQQARDMLIRGEL